MEDFYMNIREVIMADPMAEDELKQELEKLLFNFLKDYIDNVGKRFYNVTDNLEVHSSIERPKFEQLYNAYTTNKINEARISTLKRFSHVPAPPKDEEWSEEYQKGVEHGVLISQQKLRFEIHRLKELQREDK